MTPEKLAELIDNLKDDYYSKGHAFDDKSLGEFIAAELLNVEEVKEKDYITVYYNDRKKNYPKEVDHE